MIELLATLGAALLFDRAVWGTWLWQWRKPHRFLTTPSGDWDISFNRRDYRERKIYGYIIEKHVISDGGYPYTIASFPCVKRRYFFTLPWALFRGWREIQGMHRRHKELGYVPEYD